MANPNYFKLRDYLQSLIDMTIEAENKILYTIISLLILGYLDKEYGINKKWV